MTDPVEKVRALMDQAEDVDLPADMAGASGASPGDAYAWDEGQHPGDDRAEDMGGPDGGDPPDGPQPVDPELIRRCASLPLNDFGNGQRFALYFGDDVIWVPRVGWFVWNGQRWKEDPDLIEVRRRAQKISDRIEREIPFLVLSDRQMELLARERALRDEVADKRRDSDESGNVGPEAQARIDAIAVELAQIDKLKRTLGDLRKAHRSFARTSGNTTRITAATTEAGIGLTRQIEQMDATPLDVNTESGVLRFSVERGSDDGMSSVARADLIAHDRAQLLTKMVATDFDPDATCPRFDAFLMRVQPNIEMRRFLQRWFGLSMTGLTGEQKLVFLYGAGANGKSVLVDLISRILGDYAATAKIESLIGKNRRSGGDATPDLIPLVGARFVRASEPEEGERLQEAKIKELTGGEPMLVRGLQANFFLFQPLFKLTISGNHKPDIRGTDDGIWRRLLLVPFDVQIPKAERDPDLVAKLFEERAGILNWLRDGLIDYLENGLQEPELVVAATQEYRADSDPVGTMLTDVTVVSGSEQDFITARELIEGFQFWMEERGETRWGNRTVSLRLKEKAGKWRHPGSGRTFVAGKSGVTGYRGIRLTDVFRDRFDRRPNSGRQDGTSGFGGGEKWDI